MITYCELPVWLQSTYGIYLVFLVVGAIAILNYSIVMIRKKEYYLPGIIITAAVVFMLQGVMDINGKRWKEMSGSIFSQAIEDVPFSFWILFAILCTTVEIIFVIKILKGKKNRLSPGAIKEGLDALPDGICFFAEDGQPLLVNIQMNHISGELFHQEILNGHDFWDALKEQKNSLKESILYAGDTVLVHSKDGKIWDIHRNVLTMESSEINELIAYDVTKQYGLKTELERRNYQLSQVNQRLRSYSQDVDKIIAEKEILAAKMQVHDNVGRSLLAFRSYLAQPKEQRNRKKLLNLWRYTIRMMKNETKLPKEQDSLELLLKAARAVNVEIIPKGNLPEKGNQREVLIAALHECLTNIVKHANGSEMHVTTRWGGKEILMEITNDGNLPKGPIKETGGLNNLRHTVERAGGTMMIKHSPRFILEIRLPKGEETE